MIEKIEEKISMREVNKNTLKLYWQETRKHKKLFFLSFFVPLSALFIDTFLPYALSQAIGALTQKNQPLLGQSLVWAAVVMGCGVLFNLIGFQTLVRQQAAAREGLINETFEKIIRKDQSFFVHTQIGALTTRFLDFVNAKMALEDLIFMKWMSFSLSVIFGVIIIAINSWLMALIIVFLIGVLFLQVNWSLNKRKVWRVERKTLRGETYGAVADAISNNVVVKTFAKEKQEIKKIAHLNDLFKKAFVKDIGFLSMEGTLRLLVMYTVQVLAIGVAAYLVFNYHVEIAFVIFTLTYLQRIASQLFALGDMLNGVDQAFVDAAPMTEILMKDNLIRDKKGAKKLQVSEGVIEFVGTDYRYNDGNVNVLDTINLRIAGGQKVGVVGFSGAGKTTITHLLLRFADVTGGAILIDGQDIRQVTQESLRKNIAYVPQEPLLFHRTIRENIAYGSNNEKPDEEQIIRAAKQAHALEFIEALPKGLDTIVGERGVKLSGGQRQRVAIARAILKGAPILVLDEATSALDSESEKLIQEALTDLMKGKTVIVIAHRLSTIAKLDRLVVLDKGKIVEDGRHDELVKKGGIYGRLWEKQSGGFIRE